MVNNSKIFLICEKIYKKKIVCVAYHYGIRTRAPVEGVARCTITLDIEIRAGVEYDLGKLPDIHVFTGKALPAAIVLFEIVLARTSRDLTQLVPPTWSDSARGAMELLRKFSSTEFVLRWRGEDRWHIEASPPELGLVHVVCPNALVDRLACVSGAVDGKTIILAMLVGDAVELVPAGRDFASNVQVFASTCSQPQTATDLIDLYTEYMTADALDPACKGVNSMGEAIQLSHLLKRRVELRGDYLVLGRDLRVRKNQFYMRGWKGLHRVTREDAQYIIQCMYRSTERHFLCGR